MDNRRNTLILGIGTVLVTVLLAVLNLMFGNLNQDEGWYLYAAKMVGGGAKPYADFAFTQGPVMPYAYRLLLPMLPVDGVAGGRMLTALFGILSGMLAAAAAARMVDRNRLATGLAVAILVGCNVYQSYFTTVVKTYGLCAFLLMAGFFALTFRKKGYGALVAGGLIALAAGTRLSAGLVLPITGIWLIFQRERRGHWIWFGIGGGLTLLAVFLPFLVTAPEQTFFGLVGYHAGRDSGGWKALLILKAGFVSRFVQAYFVFALMAAAAFCWRRRDRKPDPGSVLLWACGLGISLLHLLAAFPYDDYQTIAYPILAAALAVTLVPRLEQHQLVRALGFLLLISVAAAFSSPINQEWFVRGRDRIWWRFKTQSDLAMLRDAAAYVRANSPEDSVLLTQDIYLAVEADRRVPPGMEMGPFCYYPELPREQAERLHLLNREMLLEILQTSDAPLAAFSGYGLSIESPGITELPPSDAVLLRDTLQTRYARAATYPHFGQAHTTLEIYQRKDAE